MAPSSATESSVRQTMVKSFSFSEPSCPIGVRERSARAARLSALLGAPWPMIVSTLLRMGLSLHASSVRTLAARIAFRIASTSCRRPAPWALPAVGLVAPGPVLRDGRLGAADDGEAVVIPERDQLLRAEVSRRAYEKSARASWLSALLGAPRPMSVSTLLSMGLSVHASAAASPSG